MSIRCPECHAHAQFVASMEVPPDNAWDEIGLFLYECHCGFHGVEVNREGHRGPPDRETVEDYGCRLSAANARTIAGLIQDCADPSDRKCRCEGHLRLGRQEAGRWSGLEGLGADKTFQVEHVRA